jgi:hypothetical protein
MSSPETAVQPQPPAEQMLQQMLTGGWIAQSIALVATLGVADLLAQGPRDAQQLASATSTHADSLYRVMRALATLGVFAQTDDGRFALTPISECLRSDTPNSFRNSSRLMAMPIFWQSWGELLWCVRNGETGFRHVFGQISPFEHFAEHPAEGAIFHAAMTEMSRNVGPAIAPAYDFGQFRKIVDAGGGHGSLLISILRRHSGPRGVVFDLPQVVKGAQPAIDAAGLTGRCETVPGNLFDSIPSGADAYILKAIIHGFERENCLKILRNVRRAIPPRGRLLLIERIIPAGNGPSFNKIADLQMLVMSGGRERTPAEYEELLGAAGFNLAQIHATAAPQSIVESIPA